MPRIRSIKPEFFRHETLQELGPVPMLIFAGLWTQADKQGVFVWRPRYLHLDILPFIDMDFEAELEKLEEAGMIERFMECGKVYGYIPTFKNHQRINGKEAESDEKYPAPPTGEAPEKQEGSTGEAPEKHPEHPRVPLEREREREREREEERSARVSGPKVLVSWYHLHQEETARLVHPSDADRKAALDLEARYLEPDLDRALVAYWTRWREHWFSVKQGDMRRPPAQRRPVFLFGSFAKHLEELLQPETAPEAETAMAEF